MPNRLEHTELPHLFNTELDNVKAKTMTVIEFKEEIIGESMPWVTLKDFTF